MSEFEDRPALTLSGGERRRLALEMMFASNADVLLLDEPDNFLDVPAKRALERQIRAARQTVLMISHDREVLAGAVNAIITGAHSTVSIRGGDSVRLDPTGRARVRAKAL